MIYLRSEKPFHLLLFTLLPSTMKLSVPVLLCSLAVCCYVQGLPVSQDDNPEARELIQSLEKSQGAHVAVAKTANAYSYRREGNDWEVFEVNSCTPEITQPKPIGKQLICPAQNAGPCSLSVAFIDTQTFTSTVGFQASFSIAADIVFVKATATFGMSASWTQTYSNGKTLSYGFNLEPGKSCTPMQVMYQLRCKATAWDVQTDTTKAYQCADFPDLKDILWDDQNKWFQATHTQSEWYYVVDAAGPNPRMVMFQTNSSNRRPTSCADAKYFETKDLKLFKTDSNSLESISTAIGDSISSVTCFYGK